jgi:hypothetical protein
MLEFRILFPRCGKVIRPHREAPISNKERRRHPREACNILVDYSLKERVFRGFILNISRGGALISNGRPFLVGEEVTMVFRHPISQGNRRITGEIAWASQEGIGVKFKSTVSWDYELDLYRSRTDQEKSIQVDKGVRKMGKVKRKRVHWELSSSLDVATYRLYWSKDGEVNYDSNHADFGHVTEIILPDDVPSFPLLTGDMELGVSAINHAGNESDICRLTVDFNFEVPDAPQNLKVEDL